ncbi:MULTISPECIES: SCO family protein [unclassified Pseudoalteromonas]|uniref:SCO family protein n=1 Tax=unclassified Pseudoalteromonas TaxID=194690 RepID=UPI0007315F69|nr:MULTISPECIES: SCO family protein [unclassified Pseudoalteromonas]KTD98639.1 photosynthetic protein synthase I [Pseudoalteromonas sp. H71]MBW4967385.1 SCO family protein [Pseudoalteromonas sp. CR1]TMN80941.1 SCO family protein [Pseudoalteromonas sp. S410]TMN87768.1 SCO family protein [Pseudoalteromonas sp. S408]TMN94814.1 SCO family protein [Pseudoalteromonas sp. S407]
MKRLWLLVIVILSLFLSACSSENDPQNLNALVYENAKSLSDFTLKNQLDEPVTKAQFKGQWNLVFLGYTSCPDICPLTLAKLNAVYKELEADYPLQIWFVSVDPNRDTAEKRKQYIDYFNPNFLAVSGQHKDLFPVVRELGLIYAISDTTKADYAVDHSASVALVDDTGALRAIFKPEFKQGSVPLINSTQLTQEFKVIANYY